jgi:hypothetical protein
VSCAGIVVGKTAKGREKEKSLREWAILGAAPVYRKDRAKPLIYVVPYNDSVSKGSSCKNPYQNW